MKAIRSFLVGSGVVLFNFAAGSFQMLRPERCTGACGACSMGCVEPLIGLTAVGLGTVLFRKGKAGMALAKVQRRFTKLYFQVYQTIFIKSIQKG